MHRLVWLLAACLALAACSGGQVASDDPGASAPDFSLELGEGGTFTLSEETRPVFMVFWAEW